MTAAQPQAERPAAHLDALTTLGVILFAFAVYLASPVTTSTDSAWTFHVAASILRQGNVDLDEYRNEINLQLDYRLRVVGGHIYYYYPVATPLLVTPVVWAVNQIYPYVYPTDFYTYLLQHGPDTRTARLEKAVASAIAALAAGIIYLIARRELPVLPSISAAGVFAFATSTWSTSSRALWQHGPSALFLSLALCLVFLSERRRWLILLVGLLLGYTYLIRPTNSLAVAFIGLYILINRRSELWLYVVGLTLVLVPYVLQNWLTYGNPLPPYSYQLFERLSTPQTFAEGLAGTLISPSRGLFVFTPLFLFSIYGAYLRIRGQASLENLSWYLIAVLVAHWIITALFQDWGGAWSIGPRYFADIIPFLIYFLIPVIGRLGHIGMGWRYAFAVTALISLLIQFHCSTSIDPWMWNGKPQALVDAPQRKWDWGDIQFLRGFCSENPLEGRAPACWLQRND